MNKIKKLAKNRIVNNFIVLLTGDAVSSVLNIISTALIINAIGLSKNGIILMIQSYALLFDQIFNFKIFEGLIKYISVSLHKKDYEEAKLYVKQGLFLDFITAVVAMIMGILFINVAIGIMGWDAGLKPYLLLYMTTILFNVSGVCTGVLRVFNKFNYISYINILVNASRTILFILGLIFNLKFNYYFFVELITVLLKYIMYMVFAYITLIKNGLRGIIKSKLRFDKDFVVFSINTNLASTLDLPVNTITTFIMNKYLGFESISVYKIFEKIGALVGKFSSPFNQILYPEFNYYVAKKESKKAIRLSKKISIMISGMGIITLLLLLVTYKLWLPILIPSADKYIYSLSIYILFIIFTNSTATVHSLFMALGYIRYVIPILISINFIYIIIIVPFIMWFELDGVIEALLIQAILVVVMKLLIMKKNNYRILN